MLLNGIRAAARGRGRRARARRSPTTSSTGACARRSSTSRSRASELPLGHLHPITQVRRAVEDAFLGLGYEVRDDREVETVEYNFDKLAFLPSALGALAARHVLLRRRRTCCARRRSPSQIHALEEKPPPIYMVSIGRCLPARRDHGDALSDLPPVRGARRRPRPDARRPEGDAAARDARALRPRAARPLPHALLPVHGAVDRAGRLVRDLRRRRLPHLQVLGLDRDGRRRHGRPARASRTSASTPRSGRGFAFGCGLERIAQLRHDIPDIRALWEGDLRVLRQF